MGEDHYVPLSSLVQHADSWSGKVCCFLETHARLECSLLAARSCGYTEARLLVTDLEPDHACAAWYQMRFWIEPSFKEGKRGLWQWQHSKMTHPSRAERLCLVMTVATLWLMSMAGQATSTLPVSSLDALPPTHVARPNIFLRWSAFYIDGPHRRSILSDLKLPACRAKHLPRFSILGCRSGVDLHLLEPQRLRLWWQGLAKGIRNVHRVLPGEVLRVHRGAVKELPCSLPLVRLPHRRHFQQQSGGAVGQEQIPFLAADDRFEVAVPSCPHT